MRRTLATKNIPARVAEALQAAPALRRVRICPLYFEAGPGLRGGLWFRGTDIARMVCEGSLAWVNASRSAVVKGNLTQ